MGNADTFAFLDADAVADTFDGVTSRVKEAALAGRLILVGSGPLPRKCLAALRAFGGSVPFVIEYEPRFWGTEVHGVPVLSGDEAAQRFPDDAIVIVCIWSPNHRYAKTREWIRRYRDLEVLPVAVLFWAIPNLLGPHYQLAPPQIFVENRDTIEGIFAALGDDESKRQFVDHLRWRTSLDPVFIPEPDRDHMYFDPRLFRLGADAAIADIGAFDGDTLKIFLYWKGAEFGSYDAFEPDPTSYARLEKYCSELPPGIAARVRTHRKAVVDSSGTIFFTAGGNHGSQVTKDGGVAVECCRLDEYFGANRRLHLLKMDVEGAEREALAGAWPLVERDRPVVATAVYHHPHDIFDLPSLVAKRTPDYRYAMRSYDYDGIDFVFYAIPSELAVSAE